MKKVFYLLMAAFAVLCVCSSCSNDDGNGETSYEKLIVGTWRQDKVYDVEEEHYYEDKTIAEIKTDGTVCMSYDDGTSIVVKWSIVSNTLYLEAQGEKEAYKINKLDNKEMILSYLEHGKEVEIAYFSRIK